MKLIRIYIWGFVALLLLGSCSDFLNVEPDKQISIKEQFSSEEGVLQALNGIYKSIEVLTSSKGFNYADLQGGNATYSPHERDKTVKLPTSIENSYNFNDLEESSDYETIYDEAYEIINQTNLIFENIDLASDIDSSKHQQILAESYAARGFAHFIATLFYSQNRNYSSDGSHWGIVYNQSTLKAGYDFPKRETKAETYRLIKADFEDALALYTGTQALEYGPVYSYFNTITTQALLARLALDNNDWESAASYADIAISNANVTLMKQEDYISEWVKEEEAVSEIILEFSAPRTTEGDVSSTIGTYFSIDYPYVRIVASEDLLELFDNTDIRKQLYEAKPLATLVNGVVIDVDYHFILKFQDEPSTTFMRLSELYLIRAEASYRHDASTIVSALTDLNAIRTRAGLSALENDASLNFLEELFLERRRELAFEGHLLYDLMRYEEDVKRTQDCLSSTCNLQYPNAHFILPIPYTSIELNENMIQNEEY